MTDYLRLAQQRAPQATEEQDNPYMPLAKQAQEMGQNRARTVIEMALKDDPEIAAERLRLSQSSGLPPDVVQRNLEELRVKERARAVDLVSMAQESPILYRQLVDPTFATTSIDDLDTLKNIERAVGKGVRYVVGADGKGGLPSDAVDAAKTVGLGATVGVGKMAFDMAGVVNDLIGWQSGAQAARGTAKQLQGVMDRYGMQSESSTGQAVKSGLQSAGQNLALLPVGLYRGLYATANAAASTVAGIMSAGVGAAAFNEAREQGRTRAQALTYAIPEAGFEYVFERIPASKLFGDIAANTGLLKMIGRQTVSEGWTEQVTTLAQDFNQWMNLNQDKTLAEFINERPEAAYQTFIATLVGVGVQTSTIRGINKIIESASNQALTFEQDQLAEQMALASQSLLRQRSPEQFRSHVQKVVDENDGAKKEIYIDGEVLNQLPQELLAQLPESVLAAIPEAVEMRSTVAIPMADVLTIAPGTELEQILNDNARMRPNASSRVEAQMAAELIQQEADRVLAQAADQTVWQQSSEAVRTEILGQLNETGRFTADVNEAYATLQANFFSTMAARVGVTPQELYQRYTLKVAAKQVGQGGPILDQITPEQAMATNVPVEMPADPIFAEAVGNTDGAQITENGLLIDLVRFQKPEQEGAQAIRTGVFYLPAGSKQVTGYKGGNKIYGGTDKFEGQTLIRRPLFVKGATGGKAPEAAYDILKGKGAYEAMRKDVLEAGRNYAEPRSEKAKRVAAVLEKYGADSGLAFEIVANSTQGNQLAYAMQENIVAHAVREAGYDAVVGYSKAKGANRISEVFDVREQTFPARGVESDIADEFLNQSPQPKAGPDAPGVGLEEGNKLGFWPALRVKLTSKLTLPEKPLILTGTNNKNAARQISAIDGILKKFPKATESTTEWTKMMAYALGSNEVPVPPYAFIRDLNGTGSLDKLRTLTQGQIDDASHGFENAAEFRRAYTAGELGVETTGKLFMWSFLSRGVSPYTQEALFIDAFDGADKWIAMAARGEFTKAVFPEYEAWAKSVAPKGSGQPGAGATHNLNAFGQDFLFKMSRTGADGKTHMQRLHDMMSDPNQTGKQIRREFATFGEGVGIDNKVVSFTLLVAGFNDVMVLDRVQIRQLWDDGRFKGTNLYDGSSGPDGKKLAGSSLNSLAEGARGILVYEAIERGLESKIQQMYTDLGRPQDASIGRYHWETWVADSQQEASHGTLGAILADAKGDDQAIANVSAKQGEYGAYEYGALYNRDSDGTPWFGYETPTGGQFAFSVPAFRAFLEDIKRPGTGVVPTKFKVTESGNAPWYTRPEVNKQRLEERARYWADRAGGSGEGQRAIEEALQQQAADRVRPGAANQPTGQDSGVLNQDTLEQGPRGTFNPQAILITLNENADLSTFLHESGHFFLEVMADLASQPDAPQQIRDDMAATLKWFGVPDLATWNGYTLDQKRPYHEKWAESFEQYLFEGQAPSIELQPLFRRFRSWLVNVYKSLTQFMRGRNLQVNDEIRQVMGRLIATDEQIAQAEEAAGMLPDFDATNEAIEKLQARSLRDLKWTIKARDKYIKQLTGEAKTLRKSVEDEVRKEVEAEPIYRALRFFTKGELDGENQSNKQRKLLDSVAGGSTKLDLDALKEIYGDGPAAPWRYLSVGKNGIAGKEGFHPDMAADMFGFANGDALVRSILDAEPIASVIEGRTDQRMLERHGDLATPEAIADAANEAVHNEARARSLATELKSQAEMMNVREDTGRQASNGRAITVNAIEQAAKQFAANIAARRRVKDLRNAAWQHRSAEARAGKRWQEATTKGETENAVQAKRDQLLNNLTVKALQEAQAEARKILEFFRRVTKDSNEKTVEKGRDPDVVNAMRAILAAYDVAPRLEKSALEYMETVSRNDAAMYGVLKPVVDAALINAKPLPEMTMEELRGLNDELRSMWVLAKRSRQMEVDGDLIEIEAAADELMSRMEEIGIPDQVPGERGAITNREELGLKLQFAKSILSRVEQWAERLDGTFGGPFLRLVFQPVKDAADRYRTDRVTYREKFTELLKGVAPMLPPGSISAPELGYTFGNARDSGTAELLHALLHTGNDSNKRKLLLGRGWAVENADGTLDTSKWDQFIERMIAEGRITKAHYDFAQGVWDLLEQMKPLAQETHRKVFGRYFAEVTANEVVTPFGTYRGGYVPAQTDSRLVKDAKLRELAEGENESMAYAFPASPSGFTKSRVEYNKPLLLDLRALAQHMDKVLLFSHMQGAVTDVRRLLTNRRVSYALDRIDPGAYEGMLIPWLNRAAKQVVETPVVGDRKLSRFLSAARSRAGMALMFANLSNTAQQITGFSLAAVKVKPSLMLSAAAQFTADPKALRKAVVEASPYMKNRMLNETAAMNDAVEEILVNPTLLERGQAWTNRHAYFLQAAVDNTMSPIIWTAAYNQAMEQGQNANEAVRFADGVIRQTQGSTLPEDVSRFETGPGYARLFTQFVSYFNMMANTNATAVKQIADEMGMKKGAGKLVYVALAGLLAPIWVAEAIAQAFRGGPEDDEGDGYLDDWLAAVFGFGTVRGLVATVPIVGQAAQLVVNRFNDNPADDKFSLSPAVSLIESAVSSPASVYKAIVDDGNAQKAVRDVAAAATLITGLPVFAAARPIGYLAGTAQGRIDPTGPIDLTRGLVTGTASPESRP